jgi:hypothetical protein
MSKDKLTTSNKALPAASGCKGTDVFSEEALTQSSPLCLPLQILQQFIN